MSWHAPRSRWTFSPCFSLNPTTEGLSTMAKISAGVGPRLPQVVVLFGATGDLSRRKLLPGLFHLSNAGFIPGCKIIAVALDDIDIEGFRKIAKGALDEFSTRKVTQQEWETFAANLSYVPLTAGAEALRAE